MTPDWLAASIVEALDDLLDELTADGASRWRVDRVAPPADLGPDRTLDVDLVAPDGATRRVHLAVGLAMAYLADEESAVDTFETWLRDLVDALH